MITLFLDTNIVIDFLANRQPFSTAAAQIFNAGLLGKSKIFVSAVSYNNIYYVTRQSLSHTETIKLLKDLLAITEVVDVTKTIIEKSLQSNFKDFEDAIQYNCALTIKGLNFIVTRDVKGFINSDVPVVTAFEASEIILGLDI